jgi:hypothetical protein
MVRVSPSPLHLVVGLGRGTGNGDFNALIVALAAFAPMAFDFFIRRPTIYLTTSACEEPINQRPASGRAHGGNIKLSERINSKSFVAHVPAFPSCGSVAFAAATASLGFMT